MTAKLLYHNNIISQMLFIAFCLKATLLLYQYNDLLSTSFLKPELFPVIQKEVTLYILSLKNK